jgi:hypothetical protein
MDNVLGLMAGLVFLVLGFLSIKFRHGAAQKTCQWYKKIGVEIPETLYAKQFFFVGILLIIVGFLSATGTLKYL